MFVKQESSTRIRDACQVSSKVIIVMPLHNEKLVSVLQKLKILKGIVDTSNVAIFMLFLFHCLLFVDFLAVSFFFR